MVDGQAGKGDKYRQVDQKKYAENYERLFGKFEIKNWDPDEDSTDNEENENE